MAKEKTLNPFLLPGSYLGMFAGYLFTLKDVDAFGFMLYYINLSSNSLLAANLLGGFIAGYVVQLFLRAVTAIGAKKFAPQDEGKLNRPKGL